jgi:hypothetical protein
MTTKTMTLKNRKPLWIATMGLGLLALPFAMPSAAQADDFKINLSLGNPGYYAPVAYRPAPQRVVYREYAPQRVVYVSRPYYRERVVVRNDYRRWHGHDNGHHGGRDRDDHRTAWR